MSLSANRFPAPVVPRVEGQRAIAKEGAAAARNNGSCLITGACVAAAVRMFVDVCDSVASHEKSR